MVLSKKIKHRQAARSSLCGGVFVVLLIFHCTHVVFDGSCIPRFHVAIVLLSGLVGCTRRAERLGGLDLVARYRRHLILIYARFLFLPKASNSVAFSSVYFVQTRSILSFLELLDQGIF